MDVHCHPALVTDIYKEKHCISEVKVVEDNITLA